MWTRLAVATLGLCAADDVNALPKELLSFHKDIGTAMKAKEGLLKQTGPVALSSDNVAFRLPDQDGRFADSDKWGRDKVKAASIGTVANQDFSMSRFATFGTNGKQDSHGFAAAGFTGRDKKHGRDEANFLLAATKTTPTSADLVVAMPTKDEASHQPNGLNWGRIGASAHSGHISQDDLRKAFLRLRAGEATPKQLVAAVERQDEARAAVVEQAAEARQEEAKAESTQTQGVASVAQEQEQRHQEAAGAAAEKEAGKEGATEEISAEDKKRLDDFLFYQVQLMALKFPHQSALLFATMRDWCNKPEHQLDPAAEAERLKLIEGRWTIAVDNDLPDNSSVGKPMVIEQSVIHKPFGEDFGDVRFNAYTESRFAAIFSLKSLINNESLSLYRMFKKTEVDGKERLEFDDGNVWERPSSRTSIQAAPEKRPEQPPSSVADIFSKLGDRAKANGQQAGQAAQAAVKDIFKHVGDAVKNAKNAQAQQQANVKKLLDKLAGKTNALRGSA